MYNYYLKYWNEAYSNAEKIFIRDPETRFRQNCIDIRINIQKDMWA